MALDIYSIELLDLISADTLQKIQDAFSDATGMAALATDMNGSWLDSVNEIFDTMAKGE